MSRYFGIYKTVILIAAALVALAPKGNAQNQAVWSIDPTTLSCSRYSLDLGYANLPACRENKISYLDSITFYVTASCKSCANTYEPLPSLKLGPVNIGLKNGPCNAGVAWSLSGGVQGSGTSSAYVYGSFYAQSTIGFVRLLGEENCDGIPDYTGDPANSNPGCT